MKYVQCTNTYTVSIYIYFTEVERAIHNGILKVTYESNDINPKMAKHFHSLSILQEYKSEFHVRSACASKAC